MEVRVDRTYIALPHRIVYGDSIEDCFYDWGFTVIDKTRTKVVLCSSEPTKDLENMEIEEDNRTWEEKARDKQRKIWEDILR